MLGVTVALLEGATTENRINSGRVMSAAQVWLSVFGPTPSNRRL